MLVALLATVPSWALSPDEAVAAALAVHPEVRQAEALLLQAQGERASVSLLEHNPQLSASTSVAASRVSASLAQPLSLSGAGWHARAASGARTEAAEAALHRARLVAATDARRAYVDAVVGAGTVRVAEEGVELAARLSRAVGRQAEEGEAALLDLRLARLAEVQAARRLLDARRVEAAALQGLAERTGQVVQSEELADDPLVATPLVEADQAVERSDLAAARKRLEAAEAERRRQAAHGLPPVSVGAFVEVEEGATFWGPQVGLALPLFDRNQAGRAEARGEVLRAEARVASLEARAATEVATATGRVAGIGVLAETLVVDPVQEAREALASIEAGYLAGQIDLPSAVLLQGEVLGGEAAAIALLGEIAAARLDLLLATEAPALLGGAP